MSILEELQVCIIAAIISEDSGCRICTHCQVVFANSGYKSKVCV